jgi:calcineurin-like phosphoesterase family protein
MSLEEFKAWVQKYIVICSKEGAYECRQGVFYLRHSLGYFNHANIIKYCARPFDGVNTMNAAMVANWNARVTEADTVVFLGDFGMGPAGPLKYIRDHLNGHIIFVAGNHDYKKKWEVFLKPTDQLIQLKGNRFYRYENLVLSHYPPEDDSWRSMGELWLHGHVHGAYTRIGDAINVGVDVWGFTPVSLETLRAAPVQSDADPHAYELARHDP